MKKLIALLPLLVFYKISYCQQKWSLPKCVQYAMDNNLTVKQNNLQAKLAELTFKQSKLSQIPTANISTNTGINSGSNQDPTTFALITQTYLSANMQLQSSAQIFNWFSLKNSIAANEWSLQAAKANNDKLKNDIALTVANAYLQILLTKQQENISLVQLQQSQAQLLNTRKLVNAGSLPELNAAELEAQVASDSSNYISAKGNTTQSILNLKAYMSLDAATDFEVEIPAVEKIPVENITDLQPDAVYALAVANLPQQRANDFNLKAAQKKAAAAKGAMYPTLSAYGGIGSRFNNQSLQVIGSNVSNLPIAKVTVSGVDYSVYSLSPYTNYTYSKQPFFSQLNQNFNQSIGLNLNIPVFNSSNLRTAYERSKINIQNLQYQQQIDNLTLKQNIYQAYNLAVVALEKFNAGKKAVITAERSYSFAQKRWNVGMLSTFELITNQNNYYKAKLQNVLDQFDYVFKMKVLEFYKGQGLKL